MLGLTGFQVLGGMTLYYMQNTGSNPPGQIQSREDFLRYLEGDPRFILYLRNFSTETGVQLVPKLTELPDQSGIKVRYVPQTLHGIEHALANRFGGENRLIAIENRRADTIPLFDTVICDNETWRSTVVVALQKTRLVVLAIEVKTAGVLDEIEMVSNHAAERTWLIYSQSSESWLAESPYQPLQITRWRSRIPSYKPLRTLFDIEFPNDILTRCNASEA